MVRRERKREGGKKRVRRTEIVEGRKKKEGNEKKTLDDEMTEKSHGISFPVNSIRILGLPMRPVGPGHLEVGEMEHEILGQVTKR